MQGLRNSLGPVEFPREAPLQWDRKVSLAQDILLLQHHPSRAPSCSRIVSGRVFCTKMRSLDRKKNFWLPVNYWSSGLDSPHSLCSLLPSSLKKSPPKQSFVMSHCLLWHLELGVFPISAFGVCPCSPSSAVIPALGRDSRTMGKAGMGQGEEPLTLQGLGWLGDTQEVQGIQISFSFCSSDTSIPALARHRWGQNSLGSGCVQDFQRITKFSACQVMNHGKLGNFKDDLVLEQGHLYLEQVAQVEHFQGNTENSRLGTAVGGKDPEAEPSRAGAVW